MNLTQVTLLVVLGLALNLSLSAFSQESTSSTWPPGELHCDPSEFPVVIFLCPPMDPDMPKYFPYPYNCRKYLECPIGSEGAEATCFHCAPGTVWNATIQSCDHESWTDCIIVTTPSSQ